MFPLHDLLKFIIGIINTLHTLTILLDSLMGILCICVVILCMCTMVLNCVWTLSIQFVQLIVCNFDFLCMSTLIFLSRGSSFHCWGYLLCFCPLTKIIIYFHSWIWCWFITMAGTQNPFSMPQPSQSQPHDDGQDFHRPAHTLPT